MCGRILIINHGKLAADGTPQSLVKTRKEGVTVTIEGTAVKTTLAKESKLFSVKELKKSGKRTSYLLMPKTAASVQPRLSDLAAKNKWIIWNMSEQEKQLEEVFAHLTSV